MSRHVIDVLGGNAAADASRSATVALAHGLHYSPNLRHDRN